MVTGTTQDAAWNHSERREQGTCLAVPAVLDNATTPSLGERRPAQTAGW